MKTLLISTTAGLFEASLEDDKLHPEAVTVTDPQHCAIRALVLLDRLVAQRYYVPQADRGSGVATTAAADWTEHNEGLT